jgi:hypothetical protein
MHVYVPEVNLTLFPLNLRLEPFYHNRSIKCFIPAILKGVRRIVM